MPRFTGRQARSGSAYEIRFGCNCDCGNGRRPDGRLPPRQPKHHGKRHVAATPCVERPTRFDWDFLWSAGNVPRANGCAPAVYQNGKFIGQDPDPNVRLQLSRDPAEGDPSQWR